MATESIDERAARLANSNPGNIPDADDQKTADGGGEMRPDAEPFDPNKVTQKSYSAIMADDPMFKGGKMKKGDDNDEDDEGGDSDKGSDDDDEEKDDDEEEEEDMDKSMTTMTADQLMKSLDALEVTARTGGDPDRRDELAKSFAEGTLSDEDKEEFIELLGVDDIGDEGDDEEPLEKSFSETFANDSQLSGDYEISPFLERQSQLMAESLDDVAQEIKKSQSRQGNFNSALAKSMQSIGKVIMQQHDLIKSQQSMMTEMSERIAHLENQPLPQKGVSGRYQPLQKGGMAAPKDPNGLTRQQIDRGLDALLQKSMSSGNLSGVPMAPCGEILTQAAAKFECQGKISRALANDIMNVLNLG